MTAPGDGGNAGDSSDDTASTADGEPSGDVVVLPAGTQVGRYVLLSEIGVGAMGVIYKAYDPQLERNVALKLLHAAGDGEQASRFRERLLREAQALAQLSHPNVVAVHDVGTFGEGVFIAMELVEGQTLTRWVKLEPRKLADIVGVYLAAGEGLAIAHRAGLVHRDFKPDNVLVGDDGRVRVLDFGLARLAAAERAAARRARETGASAPAPDADTETTRPPAPRPPPKPVAPNAQLTTHLGLDLTRSGTILGTPRFMAPEQHLGDAVDARADQFSFCVSLFEAVCRQFPFSGASYQQLKDAVVNGHIAEPPATARMPRWLHRALLRGLAVKPDDRWPTMDALLAEIRRHVEGGHTRLVALTVGTALAAGLIVWGVLGWHARMTERAQLCQGGPRRFDGVWDAHKKARVRDALLKTGKPYAADVWKNVEGSLDGYATRWAAMHKDSCEATRLRGEQTDQVMTLRMVCLDRKLQEMGALVDVLTGADEAMLVKAAPAAAQLSSLDACADVPGLLAESPLPADPALRARVSAIRAEVARAEALRLAGRNSNAVEVAASAVRDARTSGSRAALAEALLSEGTAQVQVDPARAPQVLTEAFWDAFATRLDRVALRAAVLAARAYAMVLRFDDSVLWEQQSRAGLDRLGGDEEEEAELYTSLFFRAFEQHDTDAQIATAAKAARVIERRFGYDDLRTFGKEQNELTALTNGDHVVDSWRKRGPLLSRQEKLLGPQHPILARSYMDLADDEVRLGHFADAHAHFARAEKLFRDAGETESVAWNALRTYQLRLALEEGRVDDAAAIVRDTMALLERLQILDSERALDMRRGQARVESRLGHAAQAIAIARRLLDDAERTHGKDNMELSEVLGLLVDITLESRKLDDAQKLAQRNLELVRKHVGEDSYVLADARVRLARVLLAERRAAEALPLIERSVPALVRAVGEDGPIVIRAERARGDALLALGRAAEAAAALQSAQTVAARVGIDPVEQRAIQAALEQARRKQAVSLAGGQTKD